MKSHCDTCRHLGTHPLLRVLWCDRHQRRTRPREICDTWSQSRTPGRTPQPNTRAGAAARIYR
jgi:hypothetical protein